MSNIFNTILSYIPNISPEYYSIALIRLIPIPLSITVNWIKNRTARLAWTLIISVIIQYICFGAYILHGVASIIICYILIKTLPFPLAHYVNFVVQFLYLFYGHIWRMVTSYGVYSTDWTVLQMLLVVRLSQVSWYRSLAFRDVNTVKPRHRQCILYEDPHILDIFGYCYLISGILIGPDYDFNTFLKWLDLSLFPNNVPPKLYKKKAYWKRIIQLVIVYFCGVQNPLNTEYTATEEFGMKPWYYKIPYSMICFYTGISKYVFMFIAEEVSCMGCGITYYVDENGKEKCLKWRNIRIMPILTARGLRSFTRNWNMSTVEWITSVVNDMIPLHYPEMIRHMLTYTCSVLWHGFYPGYLLFFLAGGFPYELLSRGFLKKINTYMDKRNPLYYVLVFLGWLFSLIIMSFPYLAFNLMDATLIFKAWKNLYFYYYIILALMWILGKIIPGLPKDYWDKKYPQKQVEEKDAEKKKSE